MSVLKNKRTLSDLEFYHNAVMLRRNLTYLLLKDFGIKDKVRNAMAITNSMSEEDKAVFEELVAKYGKLYILDEYPDWFVNSVRNNILNLLHRLMMNITQANSIYPYNEPEFYSRRNFQNYAIGNCEQLLQEMQYIISIIPVDINKYTKYTQMIEKEIALLKGWRKSDNRILKKIRKQNLAKEQGTKKVSKEAKNVGCDGNSEEAEATYAYDAENAQNIDSTDAIEANANNES